MALHRPPGRLDEEDVAQDGEDQDLECFGCFQTQIVGIQYYEGRVNIREMVKLVREPHNPYDRWAVRVDNILGDKVAGMVDSGMMQIEGVVPSGVTNMYKMPVQVYCFGAPNNGPAVSTRLANAGLPLSCGSGRDGAAAPSSPTKASRVPVEDHLKKVFADLEKASSVQRRMTPALEVMTRLFPHQQEALAWMVERENSSALPPFWEPAPAMKGATVTPSTLVYTNTLTNFTQTRRPPPLRGGLMADDMGLGKTLVCISLIATNRPGMALPPVEEVRRPEAVAAAKSTTTEPPAKRRKKAKDAAGSSTDAPDGSLLKKTAAKASGKKAQEAAALQEALAAAEAKVRVPKPPTADGPRATLIVCPLSVLSNWQTQIEEHTAGNLEVYTYYGGERNRSVSFLSQQDIVLTTYNVLSTELEAKNGIMKVKWLRLMLDEGHCIKNSAALQAKAARKLDAWSRWSVTGTPIQNSLKDLYGLTAFLRLEPLEDRGLFVRTIERPVKSGDPVGVARLQVLMHNIGIRRTKATQVNGRPLVELPPRDVHNVSVSLDKATRAIYDAWSTAGKTVVARHLEDGTLLRNYTRVLEIILRLRQICDAASLCKAPPPDPAEETSSPEKATPELLARLAAVLEAGGDEECAVCLNELFDPVITQCAHVYCRRCIETVIVQSKAACPLCRAPVQKGDLVEPSRPAAEPAEAIVSGSQASAAASAKVLALMQALQSHQKTGGKAVVFSQFTGMLDLVGAALRSGGIAYVRLDGSTSAKRRQEMITAFGSSSEGSPRVFLASLKAGGVGMNLTAADSVHILEPWWNSSVEEQAADRVHRLGQRRPVNIYRYVVKDSIEERMHQLQQQKQQLLAAAFERRTAEEQRQMRINDIKLLMSL